MICRNIDFSFAIAGDFLFKHTFVKRDNKYISERNIFLISYNRNML